MTDLELPIDPDLDHAPPELADLDGTSVELVNARGRRYTGSLLIVPELFGHVRRMRDGTYHTDDDGGTTT